MTNIILPATLHGGCRTGKLPSELTVAEIKKRLGFKANAQGDPDKVKYEWSFTLNGHECGIWDYKGSRWSVYDPHKVLHLIFPEVVDEAR